MAYDEAASVLKAELALTQILVLTAAALSEVFFVFCFLLLIDSPCGTAPSVFVLHSFMQKCFVFTRVLYCLLFRTLTLGRQSEVSVQTECRDCSEVPFEPFEKSKIENLHLRWMDQLNNGILNKTKQNKNQF